MRAVMHEVPESCVPAACIDASERAELRVPCAWGGGDEPLYTWYRVLSISVCEGTAYKWLVIEERGEDLVAHDYLEGKVEVLGAEEAEEFEPPARRCFKVVSDAPARELLSLLTSYAEEASSAVFHYEGLLAEYFLSVFTGGANVFEVERAADNKLTINGKEFQLSDAREWLEEREAMLIIMHSRERALREWSEEYAREPERAAKRLLRMLEWLEPEEGGAKPEDEGAEG
jgi:hypothetical protein